MYVSKSLSSNKGFWNLGEIDQKADLASLQLSVLSVFDFSRDNSIMLSMAY